jgi:hypothetical protein
MRRVKSYSIAIFSLTKLLLGKPFLVMLVLLLLAGSYSSVFAQTAMMQDQANQGQAKSSAPAHTNDPIGYTVTLNRGVVTLPSSQTPGYSVSLLKRPPHQYPQEIYGWGAVNSFVILPPTISVIVVSGIPGVITPDGFGGFTTESFFTCVSPWPGIGLPEFIQCPSSQVVVDPATNVSIFTSGYVPADSFMQTYSTPQTTNIYNNNTYNNTYNYYNTGSPASNSTPSAQEPASTHPSGSVASLTGTDQDAAVLAQALRDISRSWLRSDVSLLSRHMRTTGKVEIYQESKYQYSITPEALEKTTDEVYDYLSTRSFEFNALRSKANGEITAYATQVYYVRSSKTDDAPLTMYMAYSFKKSRGIWSINAISSSLTPFLPSNGN